MHCSMRDLFVQYRSIALLLLLTWFIAKATSYAPEPFAAETRRGKELAETLAGSDVSALNATYRWYGWKDLRHNIGQFVPAPLAHPISYLNDAELHDLQVKIDDYGRDIAYLKKEAGIIGPGIEQLMYALPKFVRVHRDENGLYAISQELWLSLKQYMYADVDHQIISKWYHELANDIGNGVLHARYFRKSMETPGFVDAFLDLSRDRIRGLAQEEVQETLSSQAYLPRDDVVKLIKDYWQESESEIRDELAGMSKQMEHMLHTVSSLQNNPKLREEIREMAEGIWTKALRSAQLGALADHGVASSLSRALNRVNYFSETQGAVIDGGFQAKAYEHKLYANKDWWTRLWARASGAVGPQKPPETALKPWEEFGECFRMDLSEYAHGRGLSVKTRNYVIPDEVVVEHVPDAASLLSGDAPKEMELLAWFPDAHVAQELRDRLSPWLSDETSSLPAQMDDHWVKLGEWTFQHSEHYVQVFDMPPLGDWHNDALDLYTNRFIVRVKDNWSDGKYGFSCLYRVRLHGKPAPSEWIG